MQGDKFIVICYKYFPLIKHILDVIEPQQTLPEILTKPEFKLLRKLLSEAKIKNQGYILESIITYSKNLKYISEPDELKNIAWLIKDQNNEICKKIMNNLCERGLYGKPNRRARRTSKKTKTQI